MNSLRYFINNFKLALQKKKSFFTTKHKLISVKILQFLYSKGFIKNYEIKDIYLVDQYDEKKKIKKKVILINLPTSALESKIIDIHPSLVKTKQNITYRELLKNNRKDFIILISTNAGIMSDFDAIKYKKGGVILCVFELM